MVNDYSDLMKSFARSIISSGAIREPKFKWTKEREDEFNRISIQELIENEYFAGQKNELYPVHMDDVINIFERKIGGEDIRVFYDSEAIRSGKTHKAAIMMYISVCKHLAMMDFTEHYQIGKNSGLAFLSTSRDNTKAKDVTFEKVLPVFLNSGFVTDYFPPDVTMEEVQSFKRKPDRLHFPTGGKNKILLFTQSGMLGELGAIGYDLIYAVIDEINFFPVVKQSKRALQDSDGTFDAAEELLNTALTRIGAQFMIGGKFAPFSLVHCLSARRGNNDFLNRKKKIKKKDPFSFFVERAIWEAIPPKWNGLEKWCGEKFDFNIDTMRPCDMIEARRLYQKRFGVDPMSVETEVDSDE